MSTYCPHGRLPRVLRFLTHADFKGDTPALDVVAALDADSNLVLIMKEAFDTLTPRQQERVRRVSNEVGDPYYSRGGVLTLADLEPYAQEFSLPSILSLPVFASSDTSNVEQHQPVTPPGYIEPEEIEARAHRRSKRTPKSSRRRQDDFYDIFGD